MIYELNSIIICLLLLALMLAALWACMKLGRKRRKLETEEIKSQNISVQASIVGMLALLLGFTFSMSLQRYDDRSKAVVAEANAIGTAALRAASLPAGAPMPLRHSRSRATRAGASPGGK